MQKQSLNVGTEITPTADPRAHQPAEAARAGAWRAACGGRGNPLDVTRAAARPGHAPRQGAQALREPPSPAGPLRHAGIGCSHVHPSMRERDAFLSKIPVYCPYSQTSNSESVANRAGVGGNGGLRGEGKGRERH